MVEVINFILFAVFSILKVGVLVLLLYFILKELFKKKDKKGEEDEEG